MAEKLHNIVYKTTNLINNKIYIGVHSTDNLDDGYIGSGRYFLKAVNKHGYSNFKKEIIQDFKFLTDALNLEKYIVNEDFIKREDNYNLALGGNQGAKGIKHSKDSINKRSKTKTGIRKPLSEETKIKIGLANKGKLKGKTSSFKGKHFSDESKEKLSKSLLGKIPWNKGLKKCYSEETCKKMSKSQTGKKRSDISILKRVEKLRKKVICVTTGEVFNCSDEARTKYGKNIYVNRCCSGFQKSAGKLPDGTKLTWRYI